MNRITAVSMTKTKRIGLILCAGLLCAFSIDHDADAKGKAVKKTVQKSTINYNDPAFKEVKELYAAGRWKECLTKIGTMKPNELTHYYTGLCYQGQNQLAKAAMEFQWIATYGNDPRLKYNAQVILNSLSAYSSHRTYSGQGNVFARTSTGYSRSGGARRG